MKVLSWAALMSIAWSQGVYAQILTPDAINPTTGTANTNTMTPATTWNSQGSYWQEHFSQQPYFNSMADFPKYEPAYRYGVSLYSMNYGREYDQLDQSQISTGWEQARGSSPLSWSEAQNAVRDAYTHMSQNHDATGNATNTYESMPVQQAVPPQPTAMPAAMPAPTLTPSPTPMPTPGPTLSPEQTSPNR